MQVNNFFKRRYLTLLAGLLSVSLLTGCETVSDVFGNEGPPPLTGERISILQLQKELVPNPALEEEAVVLPDAWDNKYWPQVGGYPNHAMAHVALGEKLDRVWKTSIGKGGDDRTPLTAVPVTADGKVFTLDTAGNLAAFDLENGKRLWRETIVPKGEGRHAAVGGGVAWDSNRLFVTAGYKHLLAVN
ncbi:MAG TPA: PQQ-binding-like beta-propeller repeat protein, partial [Alphaproteobacteria bacterium]|nr:PQQ-binding-like beta-propeller repeat protein [Alphaproteobacteria bacterium]